MPAFMRFAPISRSVLNPAGVEFLREQLAVDLPKKVRRADADRPVSHRGDDVGVLLEPLRELLPGPLVDLEECVDEPVNRLDPGRGSTARFVIGNDGGRYAHMGRELGL